MAKTKDELKAELDERGIAYPEDAKVADLEALLDGTGGQAADQATEAKHPASIVEPLPDDEKPGPGSVMSREIRPDEQDLPPGTSALQAPPTE